MRLPISGGAEKGPSLFHNELLAANAARVAIGDASNDDKALGPFAAAGGRTSVAE